MAGTLLGSNFGKYTLQGYWNMEAGSTSSVKLFVPEALEDWYRDKFGFLDNGQDQERGPNELLVDGQLRTFSWMLISSPQVANMGTMRVELRAFVYKPGEVAGERVYISYRATLEAGAAADIVTNVGIPHSLIE